MHVETCTSRDGSRTMKAAFELHRLHAFISSVIVSVSLKIFILVFAWSSVVFLAKL